MSKLLNEARILGNMYIKTQKLRIASELMLMNTKDVKGNKGKEKVGDNALMTEKELYEHRPLFRNIQDKHNELVNLEVWYREQGVSYVQQMPCYDWLGRVRGIGPSLSLKIISTLCGTDKVTGKVVGPERFMYVSKLWKWFGLDVLEDGTVPKKTKGEKLSFDSYGKSVMLLCVDQFIKSGDKSPFYKLYLKFKEEDKRKHPTPKYYNVVSEEVEYLPAKFIIKGSLKNKLVYDAKETMLTFTGKMTKRERGDLLRLNLNDKIKEFDAAIEKLYIRSQQSNNRVDYGDLHLHLRAKRKVARVFLCFVWESWQEGMGIEPIDLWITTHGGHEHKLDKWDFIDEKKQLKAIAV